MAKMTIKASEKANWTTAEKPVETSETPAENVLTDETPAEAEKPVEKPAKAPKKTLKTSAEEMLKEAGIVPVKIDKKGRYYFKEFYVMFRKEGVRLHPSAKFRKAHEEVKWDFHPGWANEYATFVAWEQIVGYIKASETEKSAE